MTTHSETQTNFEDAWWVGAGVSLLLFVCGTMVYHIWKALVADPIEVLTTIGAAVGIAVGITIGPAIIGRLTLTIKDWYYD